MISLLIQVDRTTTLLLCRRPKYVRCSHRILPSSCLVFPISISKFGPKYVSWNISTAAHEQHSSSPRQEYDAFWLFVTIVVGAWLRTSGSVLVRELASYGAVVAVASIDTFSTAVDQPSPKAPVFCRTFSRWSCALQLLPSSDSHLSVQVPARPCLVGRSKIRFILAFASFSTRFFRTSRTNARKTDQGSGISTSRAAQIRREIVNWTYLR